MEPRCEAGAKTDVAEVPEEKAPASGEEEKTAAKEKELEIGFWIGRPVWGRGYIPEAVRCLEAYAFETLGCSALWCGYYDGNEKSKRVAEKCGFRYHHTNRDLEWKLLNKTVTEHVYVLEKKPQER